MYSEIFLKNSTKLLRSPFPVTLLTFLLEEHSKGTWTLKHSNGTQRALERHSKGTWALRHSVTCVLETLKALYLAD